MSTNVKGDLSLTVKRKSGDICHKPKGKFMLSTLNSFNCLTEVHCRASVATDVKVICKH